MLFDTLKRKNKAEQEEQEWNANRPADYVSQNKEAMDALTGQIGSGYDGSELAKAYQQYRDQTADTAAAAADNTRANAAALSGGYGNSWADSLAAQGQGAATANVDAALTALRSRVLSEYKNRQSGLVEALRSTIVFEPEFRNSDALRGIEDFSHLWLIWQFSEAVRQGWSPTVRPPRLGGNTRMGVFATRSPFRPNNLGLSSVRLLGVEQTREFGTVLHVGGGDLMDGTPIFDIKPYIPYADCHPEATEGFTGQVEMQALTVEIPPELLARFPVEKRDALVGVLAQDPRPRYQADASRVYGLEFGGYEVKFTVSDQILTVTDIAKKDS